MRATWSNGDKTLELHGNGSTPYGTVLAVSTGVTNFDFEIAGGGVSAAALGVFLPSDYGDAPASFGDAGHYIRQSFTGGLPGATKVYDPVSTAFTSFATISDAPTVYLGPIKPDADPGTQNAAPNATNALGDDLNNTDDEDSLAPLPVLTTADTRYSLSAIPVLNTTGAAATLAGWIDFNQNGQFEESERATATVPASLVEQTASLTWSDLSGLVQGQSYLRLRVSDQTEISPTGSASIGEVEDYALLIQLPLAVTLASFDAQAQAGYVLVTWETVSEMGNTGFNLYRTAMSNPPTTADLLAAIPSQGPGSTQGFFYSYQDDAVTAGETYWYWLEDVDLSGATALSGPASVVYQMPTAVTLGDIEAEAGQPAPVLWPWLLLAGAALALAGIVRVERTNA